MNTFRDREGTEWTISVTVATLKRIRDLADVDLANPEAGEPPNLLRLDLDIACLVDCLWAAVKPEADRRDVGPDDFADRLGGQAVADARAALLGDLRRFFTETGRGDRAAMVDRQTALIEQTIRHGIETVNDPTIEATLTDHLTRGRRRLLDSLKAPGP